MIDYIRNRFNLLVKRYSAYLICSFILFNPLWATAQTATADFTVLKTPSCTNEYLQLQNSSTGADSYLWDFCTGELADVPNVDIVTSDVKRPYKVDVVNFNGQYIGFTADRTNKTLWRLDFADSTLSDYTAINLNTSFSDPLSIEVFNLNGEWNGLLITFDNNLHRLNFGNSPLNTPSVQSLGNVGNSLAGPIDLVTAQSNAHLFAYVANFSATHVTKVQWDNAFGDQTVNDIEITGVSQMTALSIINQEQEWVSMIASRGNDKIFRVELGTDLISSTPVVTEYSFISQPVLDPTGLSSALEGGEYYHFIETQSGNVFRINDGQTILDNSTSSTTNMGKFGTSGANWRFSLFQLQSRWHGFATTNSNNNIYKFTFSQVCDVSQETSTNSEPSYVSFGSSDTYGVELKVFDSDDNLSSKVINVNVTTDLAPDIDFSTSFPISCVNNPIDFTAVNSSGDIQFYDWDFGDGATSTAENPSHAFTTPGTYEITLSVTDPDPCDNFIRKSITIYEDPVGTFDIPTGVICTNQPITFTNTTPDSFEGNETYEWQIDGSIVSTERDLNYEFASGGMQEIKLITSIPGCSNETMQDINVIAGPAPNFTVSDNCVGTLFDFNNTTTGANITSYTWDFDNGFMSTEENPQPFEYSQSGVYNVSLTTVNMSGCETTVEKPLTVYDLPQVDFSNDLACEDAPTQFNDLSEVDNANIESWRWDFDDTENNISTNQNPQHSFTNSGQYDVKLTATTTFGCIDSLEQTVQIKTAPEAAFSFDKICLEEEVQFQDESLPVAGEVLTSWAWNLGGVFSDAQNPVTAFDFAIDYDVSLTVTSQNLCSNTIEETITVNPIPVLDFDVEDACGNEQVHFYDVTASQGDPIIERLWQFSDLGTQTDSSTYFEFDVSGIYEVSLGIVTAGGCEYTTEQEVVINEPPKASFDVSSTFGAPPFEVQLINTSEGATAYDWDFGGLGISSEENPTFTFQEEGAYEITLAATNLSGCSDTSRIMVNALFPDLEVELRQLTIVNNKLILTIQNNGTLAIDSLKAIINLGDEVLLEETIYKTLLPSGNPTAVNHTLDLNLASRNVEFICVTIESFLDDIEDSDEGNNTKCNNFESKVVFTQPFPNPASDNLNIKVLSKVESVGQVRLISSLGEVVSQISFDGIRGKNEVAIDISNIKGGIYLLEVEMAGEKFTTRIAINN